MPKLTALKNAQLYGYIVEDPESINNRIFIDNREYNLNNLTPKSSNVFAYTGGTASQTTTVTEGPDWKDQPVIITQGKYGSTLGTTRTWWQGKLGIWDPWLCYLDYTANSNRTFFDRKDSTFIVIPYPRDNASDIRADILLSPGMTNPPVYKGTTLMPFVSPIALRDDNWWWGLDHNSSSTSIVLYKLTTSGITSTVIRTGSSAQHFILGPDKQGSLHFLEVSGNTNNYTFYRAGYDLAGATLGPITGGLTGIIDQYPSNFKNPTARNKVFYSSHYNSSSVLAPIRFTWDSVTGTISTNNCTMTYPGANTYSTYSSICTNSNYSTTANNLWWIKPHVFLHNGTYYITFTVTEKCIPYFPTERWNSNQRQRTWITYTIDSTNDDQLTFHSVISWSLWSDLPRSWVPINDLGNKLLVFQTGKTTELTFDSTTGWTESFTQNIDVRTYGIDSTGRIYLITRSNAVAAWTSTTADTWSADGYNTLYVYEPNVPENLIVSTEQSNYTYTNSDINTNLIVQSNNKTLLNSIGKFTIDSTLTPFGLNNGFSYNFDGSTARVYGKNSEDFNFYTGDFTVEFYLLSHIAWSSQTNLCGVVGHKSSDTNQGWQIYRNTTNTNRMCVRYTGTNDFYSTLDVSTGSWDHWALVRSGNTLYWYKNGTAAGTASFSGTIWDKEAILMIGYNQASTIYFNGRISNLRIHKGIAVYTGSFTPSTSTLLEIQTSGTNISATSLGQCKLLTACTNKLEDIANNTNTSTKFKIIGTSATFSDNTTEKIITTTNGLATVPIKIIGSSQSSIIGSTI